MKTCALNIMHRNAEAHINAIIESCRKVASLGTEIVYKNTKSGTLDMADFRFRYTRLLNPTELIETMLEAKREGCDAIFHNCTLDAAFPEAKEVLDIPVIPIAEVSLKSLTLLGESIGVVTLHERNWVDSYG